MLIIINRSRFTVYYSCTTKTYSYICNDYKRKQIFVMKQIIIISLVSLLVGLCSCNSSPTFTRASGAPYEMVVVMDKAIWDSPTGEIVKEELIAPVPYLPEAESAMRLTYTRPDQFESFLMYVRNILFVNIDKNQYTIVSLQKSSDRWAQGQAILHLNAPDASMLEEYLAENKGILVNYYNKEEMRRSREFLGVTYSTFVMEKVKDKFGITINAPNDITAFKDGTDCLWFSNDATVGRTDLLIYTFPYTDISNFTLEYLVAKRDSVAKAMVPGSFEGSYMSTEKRVVDYFSTKINGKYCGILRGLWRMEGGDMMGGPFVSYARVDEQNQRVIVTEGFVFEPRKEKKNYIRRLEAALQTTRLPDELAIANTANSTIEESE